MHIVDGSLTVQPIAETVPVLICPTYFEYVAKNPRACLYDMTVASIMDKLRGTRT